MSQKLTLPVNKCKLTASMKTAAYKAKFGFEHYGVDMVGADQRLYASGNGVVLAAGKDNVVGNVLVIQYPDAVSQISSKAQDVVFRYFHLAEISVKIGQPVTKDTVIGRYGNTGMLSMPNHLHLEADTDVSHPLYSPTVSNSNFLKGRAAGATDATMSSAMRWLHCKSDAPDNQTYTTAKDQYILAEDASIPIITRAPKPVQIQGIDVSKHNGAIDWNKVKQSGKSFVFVRLGWAGWDGAIAANGGLDAAFDANVKGALAAGLSVGVYVYSYVKTPQAAITAAKETLALVKPYRLRYPVAFDIEDTSNRGTRYDKMSKAENAAIANAFLSAVRSAGYQSLLYTYKSFAENYLDMAALSDYDVWIANYSKSNTYQGKHTIWQYMGNVDSFTGFCPGVTGPCDLNVSYVDYAATNPGE